MFGPEKFGIESLVIRDIEDGEHPPALPVLHLSVLDSEGALSISICRASETNTERKLETIASVIVELDAVEQAIIASRAALRV